MKIIKENQELADLYKTYYPDMSDNQIKQAELLSDEKSEPLVNKLKNRIDTEVESTDVQGNITPADIDKLLNDPKFENSVNTKTRDQAINSLLSLLKSNGRENVGEILKHYSPAFIKYFVNSLGAEQLTNKNNPLLNILQSRKFNDTFTAKG